MSVGQNGKPQSVEVNNNEQEASARQNVECCFSQAQYRSPTVSSSHLLKDEDKNDHYSSYLIGLRNIGRSRRSDQDQPNVSNKPDWFDEELFKQAKSVYERHFMGINFAHLSGLLLLVRIDSIYETLSKTGESDSVSKLFKRYYHTVKHVKTWYEGDIFEESSEAHRSLLIVRGMHNKVSKKLNDNPEVLAQQSETPQEETKLMEKSKTGGGGGQIDYDDEASGVHISEYDIMITQFAFVGFIVLHADKVGLIEDFSRRDLDALLHFWRVIGYYLGASDKFNLCAHELTDIIGICEAITRLVYKKSMTKNPLNAPHGIMSVSIVRSIKFIPMLTVYGMMRHLYEILGHETNEIESRRTWYSNLSYTLIKLVMTRLLRYKPLRSFNNGLTRLSLYCVSHIEGWFSNYLDHKYGQEMKT